MITKTGYDMTYQDAKNVLFNEDVEKIDVEQAIIAMNMAIHALEIADQIPIILTNLKNIQKDVKNESLEKLIEQIEKLYIKQ